MKSALKTIGGFVFFAAIIISVFRFFFVDVVVVGHNGMAPTMEAGDVVLVWRKDADFALGAVAMCLSPKNASDYVMGRVVGKPNMTIEARRGTLEINGSPLNVDWKGEERFVDTVAQRKDVMRRGQEMISETEHAIYERKSAPIRMRKAEIKPGTLFLLGDNRHHSGQDSRSFGPVLTASCRGQVFMRLKPPAETPNELGTSWLDIIH